MIAHDQNDQPLVTILTPRGGGRSGWSGSGAGGRSRWRRGVPAGSRGQTGPDAARAAAAGTDGRGLGDEVVAVVLPERDPPSVEIHCHGGAAALELVVEALQAAGATLAEPAAWAEHEAPSRIQAEALIDLAQAPTLRTAEILLEQARGHSIASSRR